MQSSIIVSNFGPINNVSIDLSANFSVIIGPQASGKSTLAKIIYFCKKIRDYAINFIGEDETFSSNSEEIYNSFLKKLLKNFGEIFGTTQYTDRNFFVQYNYNAEDFVILTLDKEMYVSFQFSQNIENELKGFFSAIGDLNSDTNDDWNKEIFRKLWEDKRGIQLKEKWGIKTFHDSAEYIYIPAGRGILSILATQFNSIRNLDFDLSTRDFIEYVQVTKNRFKKRLDKVVEDYAKMEKEPVNKDDIKLAQELIKSILKADYVNDVDGEKLYVDSEHWISLIYGSSGQQEALWILLLMFSLILEHKEAFVILEEPEANVYPNAQKDIIKLVALTLNSTNSQILITTHSPYILTSANLLIHSGRVENSIHDEKLTHIIPKRFRIKPNSTAAYKFSEDVNGELKDIKDNETGTFDPYEIDTISDIIGQETDQLIDLEIKYDL